MSCREFETIQYLQRFFVIHKKYRTLLSAICLLIVSFCNYSLASPPERINFQNILENKDIVLGEVRSIFQDSQGFIWFGGQNALLRFDGYSFRFVEISVQTKNGLKKEPVLSVSHVYEDSKKNIWVSTQWGLLKYDPNTEVLNRVADDKNLPVKLSSVFVVSVIELPAGEILAMTTVGLIAIDASGKKHTYFASERGRDDWIQGRRINCAFIDERGFIWLGTDVGLQKLNWNKKQFSLYKPYPEDPEAIPENHVTAIERDEEGRFWLGTQGGLVQYDPEEGVIRRFTSEENNKNSLTKNDIWDVTFDSDGNLWIATDSGGINILDTESNRIQRYLHQAGRPGSLSSNVVRTVFEDDNKDIWVGNFPNGINFFDRSSAAIETFTHDPKVETSLSHNSVLTVNEDRDGNLWVGTDGGGINYFDRKRKQFIRHMHQATEVNTPSSNAILTSFIDSKQIIWVGTWAGGISSYDPSTKTWTRLPFNAQYQSKESVSHSETLNSPHVWSINEDSEGIMWITTHDGGLSRYDRRTNKFTHYQSRVDDPSSITREIVWTTFEDSSGRFWVGTSTGLNLMDRRSGRFKHYLTEEDNPNSLSNLSVLSIFEDRKGQLWFGTDAGLNLFNAENESFTRFTKADGFVNDSIRSIVEDDSGNLWLSTNNGVTRFDPDSKKIKNYNRDSGRLMGGFNRNAGVFSQHGEVILGGVNGLRIFHPEGLTDNERIPPVVLTDLKIYADSIRVGGEDGLLTESINIQDRIILDYKKSMFEFGFSALNFRDTSKNQYAYKLEGFDDDWLYVGEQRTAKYTNLNAGEYTFVVKGSNNDGVWNDKGKSIHITQLPPPWLTWWAYTLYCLWLIALVLWFIHSQRRKRLLVEEQNRILECRVAERTAELRRKNFDIQAMLSNMRQGLFTIESDEKIHPEYSEYLESIFETKEIQGVNYTHLLFQGTEIGENVLNQIQESVLAIINEDEMNFDFNSHLFIDEYQIEINGKQKILSLDWNPIVIDQIVVKIMISVRDVTELKQMELEAIAQKRELDIISQLLHISSKKYQTFEESVEKFIKENRVSIKSCDEKNEGIIALLFRNMHTIKGNCRTYGFSYLCETAHHVETTYGKLKDNENGQWDTHFLLEELDLVEKGLEEYSDIYRRVLGRDGAVVHNDKKGGMWLDDRALESINESIVTMQKHFGLMPAAKELKPLTTLLEGAVSSTLEEVLDDIVVSLPSIAEQLGKESPIVDIQSEGVRIREEAYELINNVFSHLFRNCIDHGLESTQERVEASKRTTGTITVHSTITDDRLNIHIKDDGRGLNIYHLFTIGVNLGLWKADSKPHHRDIADIIFRSGVSTTHEVTDISGRGVGMDAARQYLLECGGAISLNLLAEKQAGEAFVPFEIVVSLPSKYFIQS